MHKKSGSTALKKISCIYKVLKRRNCFQKSRVLHSTYFKKYTLPIKFVVFSENFYSCNKKKLDEKI